jgi:carbamoyl-phosphate synthase small subunit
MRGYLAIRDVGLFSGKFFGRAGSCAGELVHFHSRSFCWDIFTDPVYKNKIVVTDPVCLENRQPSPEENRSFMPHLSALVLLGTVEKPDDNPEGSSLLDYMQANRISGFVPDRRDLLYDILSFSNPTRAALDRSGDRAVELSNNSLPKGEDELRSLASPAEFLWDLTNGYAIQEKASLVVWDFGTSYRLLQSLKSKGCSLRVVPPDTPAEDIVALHPDGVIIAGNGLNERDRNRIIFEVERMIGIRPLLGIGGGAVTLASALGMETYHLNDPHFGTAIPVEEIETGRISATYQTHSNGIKLDSAEDSGAEITHINVCDESVEAFTVDDYQVIGSLYYDSFMEEPPYMQRFLDLLA